jgi:hypothetical protein
MYLQGSQKKFLKRISDFNKFDKYSFDWDDYSWHIIECAPQLFNRELFNWESRSYYLVMKRPNLFDRELFKYYDYRNIKRF